MLTFTNTRGNLNRCAPNDITELTDVSCLIVIVCVTNALIGACSIACRTWGRGVALHVSGHCRNT